MAVDFRSLVKFETDFQRLCYGSKPLGNEEANEIEVTDDVRHMLNFRSWILRFNTDLIRSDSKLFPNNIIDIFYYLLSHKEKFFHYSEMNIFDKFCISFIHTRLMRHHTLNKNIIRVAWLMYFEMESNRKFYLQGGLIELHMYSKRFLTARCFMIEKLKSAKSIKNVLEIAKNTYRLLEKIHRLSDIVETFKIRMAGQDDCLSCSKCLPLFDLLHSISYSSKAKGNDFQLVEGFIQLFLRMPSRKDFHVVCSNIFESFHLEQYLINKFEKKSYLHDQYAAASSKILHDNIFVCKNWDNSVMLKANDNCQRCVFCGEDTIKFSELFNREDVSKKVGRIKSFIRKEVSDIECSDTTNSDVKNTASYERKIDKIKEKTKLRLFLTLGVKSAISQVKTNIEKELECRVDEVLNEDIDEMFHQNKNN